jgi:phosphoglycolate phosphatase
MYFEFYRKSCRRFGHPFPIGDLDQFRAWYNPQWEENYYELGFSPEEFREVLKFWEEDMHYSQSQLFPEVAANLATWAKEAPLAIVSTTPSRMIRERLRAEDLERFFSHFTGGDDGETEKRERVRVTLAALEATQGVMVGDTPLDIDAGRHNGLRTVGVTYGWVTPDRVKAASPDRIVDDPSHLGQAVLEVLRG